MPSSSSLLLPPAACALLLLAGCMKSAQESATEAAISAATGQAVQVDQDGETVTIATGEGAMRISGGEALTLPADFPEDIYLPDDYRVRSVMDMGGTRVLSLSATGTSAQLFADARDAMARDQWTLGTAMQHETNASMLAFEKDNRAAVLSFVGGKDGDVQIGMQLRPLRQ